MFGLNLSALLDSLDNVAKETLEEPRESATEIRAKRKKAIRKVDVSTEEPNSHEETSAHDPGNDDLGVR